MYTLTLRMRIGMVWVGTWLACSTLTVRDRAISTSPSHVIATAVPSGPGAAARSVRPATATDVRCCTCHRSHTTFVVLQHTQRMTNQMLIRIQACFTRRTMAACDKSARMIIRKHPEIGSSAQISFLQAMFLPAIFPNCDILPFF